MKRALLHPFLTALYPVVALYAANAGEATIADTLRPGAAVLALAVLLLGLYGLAVRERHRAGLAVSVTLLIFFTFGHAYRVGRELLPADSVLQQANVWMAVWAAALIIGVWASLRVVRRPEQVTPIANLMAAAALIASLVPLGLRLAGDLRLEGSAQKSPDDFVTAPGPGWDGTKPDIYYIVLDGYARSDALQAYYGVDNASFLEGLRARGFVVADQSLTNYWRTQHSLAASLNYHYLDALLDVSEDSRDMRPLRDLIVDSAARRFLESQGYRTVAFSSGYSFSEFKDADVYEASISPLTEFEYNLLIGSMAVYWVNWAKPVYHRAEILHNFAALGEAAGLPGPKFVFAHMVIPHPPFVFGENGQPVDAMGSGDGTNYPGGTEHYLRGYAGQIQYTDQLVAEVVDAILANSPAPPVIILQSDHGPGAYLNWLSIEGTCLSERMPILSAYYLPGKDAARLIPADMTPVNNFRVLLNAYFDAGLPLEANRFYAVYWRDLYRFHDITGQAAEMNPANRGPACPPGEP